MTLLQTIQFAHALRKRRWNRAEVAMAIFPVTWSILFIVPTILALVL